MKVLVTGVGGQLGYDMCRVLTERGVEHRGVDLSDFDITDYGATRSFIVGYAPDAVIHCSAWTAVDAAEEQAEKAAQVNEGGARNIASVCGEIGAKILYLSTDYVFPGTGEQFYETNDTTGPLSVYGKTKLAGEAAVRGCLREHFIVRTSWVFGTNGNNFIKTMLRLAETYQEVGVVCDQVGSPTYTADLAGLLWDMIQTDRYGIYHATNEGVCSWAEFAEEIFRQAGKNAHVRYLTSNEYPVKARRPLNSRLSKASLDAAGFARLPDWHDALKRFLKAETDGKE